MPKRTNEFQELVLLIQQALMPEGAKITESALVETTDGKATREIDILIDSAIGPYRIRIAVEAKKESRRMDQVRFDSIVGKYLQDGGIRVNKIVVVSHAGFTECVISRAKLLDIELITLTEAASVDWSRLKPPEACLRSAVELIETEFDDEVLKAFGGSIPHDAEIICSCGWRYGAPANYARHVFWRKVLSEKREELIRFDDEVTANGTEKKVKVEVQPGEPHRISLKQNDIKAVVTTFSFKVRLFKPPAIPEFAGQIKMSHAPHVCNVSFEPAITGMDKRRILDESKVKCSCCGRELGTVRQWTHDLSITKFLNKNEEAQKKLCEGLSQSPTGNAHLIATWPVRPKIRIHLADQEFAPRSVKIDIHAVAAKGSLRHEQYEMCRPDGTNSRVDSFDGVVGNKRLRMVLPDGLSSKKIVVRIDDANPQAKLSGKRKRTLENKGRKIDARKGRPDH